MLYADDPGSPPKQDPASTSPVASLPEPIVLWRAGVMSLPTDRVPCPGLFWREPGAGVRALVWPEVRAMMLRSIELWGAEAAALGWGTEALFGVHPTAGAARADYTGALVTLYPRQIAALTKHAITSSRRGTLQVFRRRPIPGDCVPIWAFRPATRGAN